MSNPRWRDDGTGDFHSNGAFTAFFGANLIVIVLGLLRQRIGLTRAVGRALVTVGVFGLFSTVLYFVTLVAGGESTGIIGLIERGATHPFLIGLLCAGASRVRRHTASLPAAGRAERSAGGTAKPLSR